MMLKIYERLVGDVTVLDISGRLIQGEESVAFRDVIARLLRTGQKKILANLFDVHYIDSTGLGTIFSSHISVRNQGGSLRFLNLTKRVQDLLQVTKLYTICEVFDDEVSAVKSFEVPRFHCRCPVCGNLVSLVMGERGTWAPAACDKCDTKFAVVASVGVPEEVLITSLRIQTYVGEYLEVLPGPPFRVNIIGRLDLFSAPALTKAWLVLPSPRTVIFDLGRADEVDGAGRDALVALSANALRDERLAVSLEGLSQEGMNLLPAGPPFHRSRAAALEALGNVSRVSHWPVRIWKT